MSTQRRRSRKVQRASNPSSALSAPSAAASASSAPSARASAASTASSAASAASSVEESASPGTQRKVSWVREHLERLEQAPATAPVAVPVAVAVSTPTRSSPPPDSDSADVEKHAAPAASEADAEELQTVIVALQKRVSKLEAELEEAEKEGAMLEHLRDEIERALDAREMINARASSGAGCVTSMCLIL